MADPARKDALEREALGYIQLGTLVQRPRSEEKSEAVAKVLAESLPVAEKIRRIERIDAGAPPLEERKTPPAAHPKAAPLPRAVAAGRAPGASSPRAAAAAETPAVLEPMPAGSAVAGPALLHKKPSVVAAAKSRAHILADIAPATRLRYVFLEGRELRSKAKGNRFLKPGLFNLEFARDASRFFLESFRRDFSPILVAAIDATLRDGWRFLGKSEYNRFATLRRLVAELIDIAPNGIGQDDTVSARRFFNLEVAFLSLRSDASSLLEIAAGFDSVLAKLSYPRKMIDEARSAARRLLQNGGPPPCLQDLILAVNMVRARRFLRIRDLMSFDNAALVSVTEFDCSDETQDAIDARVADLSKRLEVLVRENEEILRLKAFVRRDREGEVDYDGLAVLYESDKARKRSWEKDESNAIMIASGIAERFLAMVLPLIGLAPIWPSGAASPGAAKPRGKGRQEPPNAADGPSIRDKALEYEVARLGSASAKIDKLLFYLPALPWPRYLSLKARASQASKFEAEGVALLMEVADIFYRTGSRLVELLRSSGELSIQGRERHDAIVGEGAELSLEEIALRQSMATATSAAYLAALLFREPTIGAALKSERQSSDERRIVLAEIERLADAETFQAARKKAGLVDA